MSASNYRRRPLEGGYECEFVEEPKELQSECSICRSILCEPYMVDCCGYKFCCTCIKRVEEVEKPCPLCNGVFISVPDRQLERQLNERAVYCENKKKGCNWIGELRQLKQHLNSEASFDSNQKLCDYQVVRCRQCQQFVERRKLNISCPHLPSEPCPYKYAGCRVNLPQPKLEDHLQRNLAHHATLAATKAEALDADIKTIRDELQATIQMSETMRTELETSKRTFRIVRGVLVILLTSVLVLVTVNYYQNKALPGYLSKIYQWCKTLKVSSKRRLYVQERMINYLKSVQKMGGKLFRNLTKTLDGLPK